SLLQNSGDGSGRWRWASLCYCRSLPPIRGRSLFSRGRRRRQAQRQVAYVPRNAADDGARLPDLSSLDISLLIRDSDRMGTAMHLRLPEYTYLQTRVSRELDQRGKMVERVTAYEAYPIKVLGHQRHVISLISEDGAPVSPKRLKKERKQA